MDFRRIRNEGYYYVDKTQYLAMMEARDSFIFFVRPRKTLGDCPRMAAGYAP